VSDQRVVTRQDVDGVAVLTYSVPGERMNVLNDTAFEDLDRHMDEIAADASVAGAVLVSGKPDNFCAGADIRRLPQLQAMDDATPALEQSHGVIRKMMDLPKPFVAAVNGVALGGGLELAMTADYRVATTHDKTQFGLPEVKLGLLPGAGGTQNLIRLLPVPVALEHLLTGKTIYPSKAKQLGLVDEVVPPNQALRIAIERVKEIAAGERTAHVSPHPLPEGEELTNLVAGARWMANQQTKGLWPAPGRIIDAVEAGLRDGLDAGMAKEREGFAALLKSPEAAAGIHLFLSSEGAKKYDTGAEAQRVEKLFVLGGGMMGAGLGSVAIDVGLDARVRDLDDQALVGVRQYADRVLRKKYEKRPGFEYVYRDKVHRLSTTTDLSGLGLADVVIEAVFEDVELKHRVIKETEAAMREDAVFASNTSAIPITRLAETSVRPDKFVGMHFFSPVEKMPLVEIITHAGTSDETLQTTLALGVKMGKVPIIVADSPGFYTSRVFGRWLAEGTRLLMEGARIEEIDGAAQALGFPVGPLTAHDEVSLELVKKAGSDPTTSSVTAERVDAAPSRHAVLALVEAGHLGRKAKKGFYTYDDNGKKGAPDERVYGIVGSPSTSGAGPAGGKSEVGEQEIANRLLYAFVTEALLCWDEGLLRRSSDGDIGAVMGIGFPPNLGGPFFHVDRIGAGEALSVIERLDAGTGNFTPSTTLRELAERDGKFGDL
jgi:3-hydroxyacyl-CoA dehydrogenase/enoyl-CoA hydratase/3-hydroxybutyryl-CoA epimerase